MVLLDKKQAITVPKNDIMAIKLLKSCINRVYVILSLLIHEEKVFSLIHEFFKLNVVK